MKRISVVLLLLTVACQDAPRRAEIDARIAQFENAVFAGIQDGDTIMFLPRLEFIEVWNLKRLTEYGELLGRDADSALRERSRAIPEESG